MVFIITLKLYKEIEEHISRDLARYKNLSPDEIANDRYEKFREIDLLVRERKKFS